MRALEVMPGHWSGVGPVLISQTDAWTSHWPDQREVALIDLKVMWLLFIIATLFEFPSIRKPKPLNKKELYGYKHPSISHKFHDERRQVSN